MTDLLTRLRNLTDPEITIDEAMATCKSAITFQKLVRKHPELNKVIDEIKQLREEQGLLYEAADEIERLRTQADSEYRRGLEEGQSCQAILEIQGRERFVAELKADTEQQQERG